LRTRDLALEHLQLVTKHEVSIFFSRSDL